VAARDIELEPNIYRKKVFSALQKTCWQQEKMKKN